ncbi:MAG: hypothetical protein IBX43_06585 [Campylobacterales bacterium]|nr:hypothetical protein [Campylobacterales bacterium]
MGTQKTQGPRSDLGNSEQTSNVASGNISPLTSFTHSDRYRFGSISNIECDDELGEREQYNYFIGATDKLASWGSDTFSPEDTPGYPLSLLRERFC